MHGHGGEAACAPKSWIAANCHANQEGTAIRHLMRQNYEVYCPMFLRRRSHARRIELVQRPLFPGYVFIHINPEAERWRPIMSTVGVRALVRFGDSLGTVPSDFILSLKAREQDGLIAAPENAYKPGEEVRLGGGVFDGITGTILSVDEKQRLVILMELLQRPVRVRVHADQVSRLGAAG